MLLYYGQLKLFMARTFAMCQVSIWLEIKCQLCILYQFINCRKLLLLTKTNSSPEQHQPVIKTTSWSLDAIKSARQSVWKTQRAQNTYYEFLSYTSAPASRHSNIGRHRLPHRLSLFCFTYCCVSGLCMLVHICVLQNNLTWNVF